jgi:hypothetical protein
MEHFTEKCKPLRSANLLIENRNEYIQLTAFDGILHRTTSNFSVEKIKYVGVIHMSSGWFDCTDDDDDDITVPLLLSSTRFTAIYIITSVTR